MSASVYHVFDKREDALYALVERFIKEGHEEERLAAMKKNKEE